jgi:hypothetical protein
MLLSLGLLVLYKLTQSFPVLLAELLLPLLAQLQLDMPRLELLG